MILIITKTDDEKQNNDDYCDEKIDNDENKNIKNVNNIMMMVIMLIMLMNMMMRKVKIL